MLHGLRAAEHVGHGQVDDMEATAEEGDVGGGLVAEELSMPDPRAARGWLAWHDDGGLVTIDLELVSGEAGPVGGCAGPGLGGPGSDAGAREQREEGEDERERPERAHGREVLPRGVWSQRKSRNGGLVQPDGL